MSTERLRQAAAKHREGPMAARRPWVREDKIAMAVADWLEDEADWIDVDIDDNGVNNLAGYGPAFALADLILGGAA